MRFITGLINRIIKRKEKIKRVIEYKRLKRVRSRSFPQYHFCKNCGAELKGMYCYDCGQYALDINQGFVKYVRQFFENTYQLDGRVLQTIKYLFTRPGFLTKEFVQGKINSYVHPMKLYMFVSLLFFSFVFTLFSENKYLNIMSEKLGSTDAKVSASISFPNKSVNEDSLNNYVNTLVENTSKTGRTNEKISYFPTFIKEAKNDVTDSLKRSSSVMVKATDNVIKETDKDESIAKKNREWKTPMVYLYHTVFSELTKDLPFVVIFLVPVYAWIMRVSYKKTCPNYMHNLVFAMHLHTVFLIFSAVAALSIHYFNFYLITQILGSVLIAYNIIAVKNFYQKKWLHSVAKSLLTLFWYSFILFLVLILAVVFIFALVVTNDKVFNDLTS